MTTITVNASKKYNVLIGAGLLDNTGELVSQVKKPCKAAIITDDIVNDLYAQRVISSLNKSGFDTCLFVFKNGEASKNMDTLGNALEFLAENQLTRSDIIIALGGGVVGDLAGFTASVYLRGIDFVQIPTTLLAAIDSSVGGKTAVDLKNGKNLAGSFYPPRLVICDYTTLDTLPKEIVSDGTAEAIKYGVLFDKELFSEIANGGIMNNREKIISRCVDLKREVVEEDEFDTGRRQLLNLGHTIGHAIEKCSSYSISHGSAVGIGMAIIAKAAYAKGVSEEDCTGDIMAALKNYNLPTNTEYSAQMLYEAALRDKKRQLSEISIVVPKRIGECFLKKIPVTELLRYIELGLEQN